ncbi:hypothetical protein Tco_1090487 [Tanacetum coccineum]|uniref:Reverse transcriptase domain-containing protein n=1 Tax=Tanacetum coccineum TaxID=301880 RepID=A0ABQ5I5B0_9ASTR
MRRRSQSRNLNRQQQQAPPVVVEPFNLEEPIENPAPPVVPMADNRTMAQLLQAPTEGYEDAIVIPEINANFELKHGTLPSNTVTNPKEDLKGITTRSGAAYKGPTIPTTPKVVECETEVTKDTMPPTNNGSTEDVQPPIVNHEPISEPIIAPVSASTPNQKTSIPFPSRRNDERRGEKANDQIEKFYKSLEI